SPPIGQARSRRPPARLNRSRILLSLSPCGYRCPTENTRSEITLRDRLWKKNMQFHITAVIRLDGRPTSKSLAYNCVRHHSRFASTAASCLAVRTSGLEISSYRKNSIAVQPGSRRHAAQGDSSSLERYGTCSTTL